MAQVTQSYVFVNAARRQYIFNIRHIKLALSKLTCEKAIIILWNESNYNQFKFMGRMTEQLGSKLFFPIVD